MTTNPITQGELDAFISILDNLFKPCQGFKNDVLSCKSYESLKKVLTRWSDDIGSRLGITEFEELEYEKRELEDRVEDLEDEIEELEEMLERVSLNKESNLIDQWKAEIISRYINDYSPIELEALFETQLNQAV